GPSRKAWHGLGEQGDDRGAVEQVHEMMERQIQHMARLVDDLLDVSRITRGKVALRPERVDLARLVRQHAADHRGALAAAGLSLGVEGPETPVWVTGDPTRLRQVLDNLLENAVKFTDRGGRVTVRLTADAGDGRVALTVRDTGIGIDPRMLPRL